MFHQKGMPRPFFICKQLAPGTHIRVHQTLHWIELDIYKKYSRSISRFRVPSGVRQGENLKIK